MPKKEEIIDYFFTMNGQEICDFIEELKSECHSCGIRVSKNIDPNDLLELLIKNVNIK
jgi:hypothetical protein